VPKKSNEPKAEKSPKRIRLMPGVDLDRFTVNEGKEFMRERLRREAKRMLWEAKTGVPVECMCCHKTTTIRIDEPTMKRWGYALWEIYKQSGTNGEPINGNKFFVDLAGSPDLTIASRSKLIGTSRDWTRWCLWGVLEARKKGKYVVTKLGADYIYERKMLPRRIATLRGDILAVDKELMSFRELVEESGASYDALLTETKHFDTTPPLGDTNVDMEPSVAEEEEGT
jgi:hypothetical protein